MLYILVYQKKFTADVRVAWASITVPSSVMSGETIDEWFPLSGKQGDEKEGTINLVLSFTVRRSIFVFPAYKIADT